MRNLVRWAATPLAFLALAACNSGDGKTGDGALEPSSKTLSAGLDGDFKTLDRVIDNAGLEAVLEGKGPYTVLAPSDAAFSAAQGADFTADTMKAQGAALVQAHILPGALTRQDIGTAIDRAADGRVQMRTMADGVVTFSRDGETIVVTAADGARARLAGDETLSSNGVIQPVDALLVKAPDGTTANGSG
ncbi:fasciclin domain-containing protein [Brevundimonas sp. Root1279]|uniref:fasciclin domain-containing protein n=1 Tax=Brevundimonas sp. Root1279 TaxID=1736443 RepID=UPI0006FE562D|nr:fasciclin domain-containing protein [Brevundimonas sp. Root1279]KQW78755.1 hypothetical protein ASC65_15685 [Brevundimonas sp. Root1279]